MGKKRVSALLNAFTDVSNIAESDEESIRQRTGIPVEVCKQIIKIAKEHNKK